jgi:hypothetical protein
MGNYPSIVDVYVDHDEYNGLLLNGAYSEQYYKYTPTKGLDPQNFYSGQIFGTPTGQYGGGALGYIKGQTVDSYGRVTNTTSGTLGTAALVDVPAGGWAPTSHTQSASTISDFQAAARSAFSPGAGIGIVNGVVSTTGYWGSQDFTTNGTTTEFVIAHNLGYVPTSVNVTPQGTNAFGAWVVLSPTTTTATVKYQVAPATGSIKLNYDIR